MTSPRRKALQSGLMIVLLLAVVALPTQAQNDEITIAGSGLVGNLIAPLVEAYAEGSEASIAIETTSSEEGLAALCGGELNIAASALAIPRQQEDACTENGIEWVEVPVAYDAAAIITNPTFAFAECLTLTELTTLWSPSATDVTTTWDQINPAWEPTSFELYTPATDSPVYSLLDEQLPGEGLRTDTNTESDPETLVGMIAEDVAGLGFTSFSAIQSSDAAVSTIALDALDGLGCVSPEQTTLEDGSYPLTRGLYLYINAESLENETVTGLLENLLGEDSRASIAESAFIAPSDELAGAALANVTEGVTGRQFSPGEPLYTIPLDLTGTVLMEAAAMAYGSIDEANDAFGDAYVDTTIEMTAFGNAAAYQRLCAGEIDIAAVTRPPTDDEAAACEDAGINLWEALIGHRAVVMLVPEAAGFAACLTAGEVTNLWQNQGEDTITNWNALNADFPDQEITVFTPRDGQSQTDFILAQGSGSLLDPRIDALEKNNDALYRAAAVANVEGAVTYVQFAESLETEAAVIPVAVDAGDGCITPSLETIRDGSYLLAHPLMLQVTEEALARPEVQSLVWYTLQRNSRSLMEEQEALIPLDDDAYDVLEAEAVEQFAAAEESAAAAAETEPGEEGDSEDPATENSEDSGEASSTEDSSSE